MVVVHPLSAGNEAALDRHDDERTRTRVVDRERHALGGRRQVHMVEDEAHGLVIAIEAERELHLLARDAIEPFQEVVRVGHGGRQHSAVRPRGLASRLGRSPDN